MARQIFLFVFLALYAGAAFGMDCSFGRSSNAVEKYLQSCPGLLDSSDKSFCCPDLENERIYCCDEKEFLLKTGVGLILPLVVAGVVIGLVLVCCVSCLCCSCCPWYRRRHRGTVYGKVQAPAVVHVVQTPAYMPQQVPYPTHSAGMQQQAPPPYAEQSYAKQAPYNPNFHQ